MNPPGLDLKAIFCEALDHPNGPGRAAYLDRACRQDAALRQQVESLLGAHDDAGGFLGSTPRGPAAAPAPDTEMPPDLAPPPGDDPTLSVHRRALAEGPGTTIGPYKLLQKIGEGGMGVVFMAEQETPIRRKVALKVIKPGMDTGQVIARFEAERQALAMMDHPNIAGVLDAGATETGRPFFVMELVKGVPITEYCDRNGLTPGERLELFIPVCQAIQHAHQKGIIHRDIKPSNVLVTLLDGEPVPKVIDFGVAKATDQRLTERTLFTEFGAIVGTLEYMSPEQAEMGAMDVDTRSDVYSLGVLLYELLTGSTPLERVKLRKAAYSEILRRIREEEPTKPSTRLSESKDVLPSISAQRKMDLGRLTKLVRGDLDWIVMKALEKDRTRRYETANGFARDIRRYLADEPVEACPPSSAYRLRKLARRHKGPLAAVGAVLAALSIGLAATTLLYLETLSARRAEAARRTEAELAGAEARRAATKAEAINKFLLNDVMAAMGPGRGRDRAATVDEVLRFAAAQVDSAFRDQPELAAAVHATIGEIHESLTQYEAAEPHLRAALEIRRRALGEGHRDTLRAMGRLAKCYSRRNDQKQADPLVRTALEAQRRVLGKDHPETLDSMATLAWVLYNQGGRQEEAESLALEAWEASRRVLGEEVLTTWEGRDWLDVILSHRRSPAEREALARESLEMQIRVQGELNYLTAIARGHLGWALMDRGEPVQAEALFRESLATLNRVLGEEHGFSAIQMYKLAASLHRQGRLAEAQPLCERAVDLLRRAFSEDAEITLWAMQILASIHRDRGHLDQAESLVRTTLDTRRRVQGEAHRSTQLTIGDLASLLDLRGKLPEAEALLRDHLATRRARMGSDHPDVAWALRNLGRNLLRQGQGAEAEPLLRECLAIRDKTRPDAWNTAFTRSLVGEALLDQGKHAEAESLMLRGYEGVKAREATIPAEARFLVAEAGARIIRLYEAWGKTEQAAAWREKLAIHPPRDPDAGFPSDPFARGKPGPQR